MAETNFVPAPEDLISGQAIRQAELPKIKRMAMISVSILVALVIIVSLVLVFMVQSREDSLTNSARQKIEVTAAGRADVIATWLDGLSGIGDRITKSDLFKLFSAEVNLQGGGKKLPPALQNQLPYMQLAATDFAQQNGIIGAYLVGRDGRIYMASAAAPILKRDQRSLAEQVYKSGKRLTTPLRETDRGLILDILFPIHPPQTAEGRSDETVGVLMISVPAATKLTDMLSSGPLAQRGERTRLVQVAGQDIVEITPSGKPFLRPIEKYKNISAGQPLSFASRKGLDRKQSVFSAGSPVNNTNWLVIHEIDEGTILAPLGTYKLIGAGVALFLSAFIVLGFIAIWSRQSGEANRALAHQFRELASKIQAQRQLLDSVNNSIEDLIGFKNLEGNYLYSNPALARAVGKPLDFIRGKNDETLFGVKEAQRLLDMDEEVFQTKGVTTGEVSLQIAGKPHYYTFSKSPLNNEDGQMVGIVSVGRDVTEAYEHKKKMDSVTRATMTALIHTIEMHDPYLAGHSLRMGEICLAIGRRLALSEEKLATLEMSANLSQIGKLSIPAEILAKDKRLNQNELELVQKHITHAEDILKEIDFGLPVSDTVAQMHERLDGSGYPQKLQGNDISLLGRIIAVADVYCARMSPRSYRATISSDEALQILANNPDKYDKTVVQALVELQQAQT